MIGNNESYVSSAYGMHACLASHAYNVMQRSTDELRGLLASHGILFRGVLSSTLLWALSYVFILSIMYLFHSPFRVHNDCRTDWYAQITKILQIWCAVVILCFHVGPHFLHDVMTISNSPEMSKLDPMNTIAIVFVPMLSVLTTTFLYLHKVKRRYRLGVTYGTNLAVILLNSIVLALFATAHYASCTFFVSHGSHEAPGREGVPSGTNAKLINTSSSTSSLLLSPSKATISYVLGAVDMTRVVVCPAPVREHLFGAIVHLYVISVVFICVDYHYKKLRGFDPSRGILWSDLYDVQKDKYKSQNNNSSSRLTRRCGVLHSSQRNREEHVGDRAVRGGDDSLSCGTSYSPRAQHLRKQKGVQSGEAVTSADDVMNESSSFSLSLSSSSNDFRKREPRVRRFQNTRVVNFTLGDVVAQQQLYGTNGSLSTFATPKSGSANVFSVNAHYSSRSCMGANATPPTIAEHGAQLGQTGSASCHTSNKLESDVGTIRSSSSSSTIPRPADNSMDNVGENSNASATVVAANDSLSFASPVPLWATKDTPAWARARAMHSESLPLPARANVHAKSSAPDPPRMEEARIMSSNRSVAAKRTIAADATTGVAAIQSLHSSPSSSLSTSQPGSTSLYHLYDKALFTLTPHMLRKLEDVQHPINRPGMVPWFSTFIANTTFQSLARVALEFLTFDVRGLLGVTKPKIFHLHFYTDLQTAIRAAAAAAAATVPSSSPFSASATSARIPSPERVRDSENDQAALSYAPGSGRRTAAVAAAAEQPHTSKGQSFSPHNRVSLPAHPLSSHEAEEPDVWFDWIADIGDGFNSTYELARLISAPVLQVPVSASTPMRMMTHECNNAARALTPSARRRSRRPAIHPASTQSHSCRDRALRRRSPRRAASLHCPAYMQREERDGSDCHGSRENAERSHTASVLPACSTRISASRTAGRDDAGEQHNEDASARAENGACASPSSCLAPATGPPDPIRPQPACAPKLHETGATRGTISSVNRLLTHNEAAAADEEQSAASNTSVAACTHSGRTNAALALHVSRVSGTALAQTNRVNNRASHEHRCCCHTDHSMAEIESTSSETSAGISYDPAPNEHSAPGSSSSSSTKNEVTAKRDEQAEDDQKNRSQSNTDLHNDDRTRAASFSPESHVWRALRSLGQYYNPYLSDFYHPHPHSPHAHSTSASYSVYNSLLHPFHYAARHRRNGGDRRRSGPSLLTLPRGSFVVAGGDLAYPNPTDTTYSMRLFKPYNDALCSHSQMQCLLHAMRDYVMSVQKPSHTCAWRRDDVTNANHSRVNHTDSSSSNGTGNTFGAGHSALEDEDVAHIRMLDAVSVAAITGNVNPRRASRGSVEEALFTIPMFFAIPGNHDWFDGLSTFRKFIIEKTWMGGRWMPQRSSYFVLKLPFNWFMLCGDTGQVQDIDVAQRNYFLQVIEQYMDERSCVILASHEPGWIFDSRPGQTQFCQPQLKRVAHALGTRLRLWIAGDLHNYSRHIPCDPLSEAPTLVVSGGGGAFMHGVWAYKVIAHGIDYVRAEAFPHRNTYMSIAGRLFGFRLINWKFDLIVGCMCFLVILSMLPVPFDLPLTTTVQSTTPSHIDAASSTSPSASSLFASAVCAANRTGESVPLRVHTASQFMWAWIELTAQLIHNLFAKGLTSLVAVLLFFVCFASPGESNHLPLWWHGAYGGVWTFAVVLVCCGMLAYMYCLLSYMSTNGMLVSRAGMWGSPMEREIRRNTHAMLEHVVQLLGTSSALARALHTVQLTFEDSFAVHACGLLLRSIDPIEAMAYLSVRVSSGTMGQCAESATRTVQVLYYVHVLYFYWVLVTPLVSFIIGSFLFVTVSVFHYMSDAAYSAFQIEDYKHFIRFKVCRRTRELHAFVLAERAVPKMWELDPNYVKQWQNPQPFAVPPHLQQHPSRWRPRRETSYTVPVVVKETADHAKSANDPTSALPKQRKGRPLNTHAGTTVIRQNIPAHKTAASDDLHLLEHFVCRPHRCAT